MSAVRKLENKIALNFIAGLFLILLSIAIASIGTILAIGFAGLAFLLGLVSILDGLVQIENRKKAIRNKVVITNQQAVKVTPAPPAQFPSEFSREIVKVRCRQCGSLNSETRNTCVTCGAII